MLQIVLKISNKSDLCFLEDDLAFFFKKVLNICGILFQHIYHLSFTLNQNISAQEL